MNLHNESTDLNYFNLTLIKNCVEWHGNEQISFQLSNFLFFIAYLTPHNASNQISDLLFRLLITMGCSLHVIWITSIKDHCFFNYIIFFWSIFLFVNFLHSFHLTYKLSPASLPKKFTKLYDTMFEPIKLTKKEFKLLTQHSLVINLNRGENYLLENESPIDEKVGILLEGKLDVSHNNVFLHHIYPNDFIDSAEFKYIEHYSSEPSASEQPTHPFRADSNCRTCSNCRQVLIDMENATNRVTSQSINLSVNNNKIICRAVVNDDECQSKKQIKNPKSKSHPTTIRHQKSCTFNRKSDRSNVVKSNDEEIKTRSIESPLREQNFESNSVNKLSQVTITASENCKLLCWKRELLVKDTLANDARLRVVFHNLVGKSVINKLYLVNEEKLSKQQQIIGETQSKQETAAASQTIPSNLISELMVHNPLRGDNLLSKFKEINLLNSSPYIPHESMMYLQHHAPYTQYDRNLNIGIGGLKNQDFILKQQYSPGSQLLTRNPYLTNCPSYLLHYNFNQAILNPISNPQPTFSSVARTDTVDTQTPTQLLTNAELASNNADPNSHRLSKTDQNIFLHK